MGFIRTFIAFDTPEDIRYKMSVLQEKLRQSRADVKWESGDKFHATIKFLGNVDEHLLSNVILICEKGLSNYASFEIIYQSLGCFPNKKHPRVIWIGCENPDNTLLKLKNSLDKDLLPLGFEIEYRSFHPHITLGRVKSPKGFPNLLPMLENLTFERQEATIQEILIMKSVLKPEGSEYSVLKTIQLKENSK
jgi:2'-5' RNA ligase